MSKIDEWIRRLRVMSKSKAHEEVRAFDKNVVMTTTQAWRFRELQAEGFPAEPGAPPRAADPDWYTLEQACETLACSEDELLAEAADGRLACYVEADRLRGTWDDRRDPTSAGQSCLAVPVRHCREIAAHGSSNVGELEDRRETTVRVFRLAEPLWVDRTALRLAHPLESGLAARR